MTAYLEECGTLSSPAATGNQTISLTNSIWGGDSSLPKVVLFGFAARTTDGVGATAYLAFGVGVSSSSRASVAMFSRNAVATSDTDRRHDNTKCIMWVNAAGSVGEAADFVSWGADQFTINWTTVEASAYLYTWRVIGGTAVEAFLDEIVAPTSNGNVSYTGVGFLPTALMGFSATDSTAPPAISAGAYMTVGMYDGTTSARLAVFSQNSVGTTITERMLDGAFLGYISGGSEQQRATGVSLDADGFTLNWTSAYASYNWVLALKGVSASVKTITQPATNSTVSTDAGFAPSGAMFLSSMAATSASVQPDARIMIGQWSNAAGQTTVGIVDEDNQSTTDADRLHDSNEAIKMINHAQTVVGSATASASGNDVDLVFTNCDTTQREIAALIFGAAAAVTPAVSKQMLLGVG